MLDLSRYGPRDFSGKVTVYPVQWCVFAPIDSVLSRREGKLRIIYDRLKKALGEQWMHGVTVELDYHCYYEFLDGYSTQWADDAYASTSCNEIDIADWVNQMRELLEGLIPCGLTMGTISTLTRTNYLQSSTNARWFRTRQLRRRRRRCSVSLMTSRPLYRGCIKLKSSHTNPCVFVLVEYLCGCFKWEMAKSEKLGQIDTEIARLELEMVLDHGGDGYVGSSIIKKLDHGSHQQELLALWLREMIRLSLSRRLLT
jgi:hypothetical protein